MRTSRITKFLAAFLAVLMVVPMAAYATPGNTSSSSSSASGIEEVEALLNAQSYAAYLSEHRDYGDPNATVTVNAADGFTYVPDAEYSSDDDNAVAVPDPVEGSDRGNVLLTPGTGSVYWDVNIPESGMYMVIIEYVAKESANTSNIKRELHVDGRVPFKEAYYLEFTRSFRDLYEEYDENGMPVFSVDADGNQKRPRKEEVFEWTTYKFSDSSGYYTDPFRLALDEGTHRIELEATLNELYIASITFTKYEKEISYADYRNQHTGGDVTVKDENIIKIQAENPTGTSDNTIYPLEDRSSPLNEPIDAARTRLNAIGSNKWQTIGQWIEWEIKGSQIKESGWYYIVPRFKQDALPGFYVSRRLTINGEIPFYEASYIQFKYSDDWQVTPLAGGDGNPYEFWFEAGKDYTIRLEVVFGDMADTLRRTEASLTAMNNIYNSVIKITGPSPDEYTDYNFVDTIRPTIFEMRNQQAELQSIVDEFKAASGGKSASHIATLEKVIYILDRMGHYEDEIAGNLDNLKTNCGTLGTWIMTTKQQALTIDYISIQPVGAAMPRANANFFQSAWFELVSFIKSFTADYNSLGSEKEGVPPEDVVEVWIATSRDDAQVMREIISESCPVSVELRLVALGTLLPATLAGIGPDISLATSQTDVINYAIRDAVIPLDGFDTFDEVMGRFHEEATVSMRLEDPDNLGTYHYYGIPERISFPMMFYRKDIFVNLGIDVPKTWDDFYKIIPELQTEHRDVGFPVNITPTGSTQVLELFMYQLDEPLYTESGKSINLDSNIALDSFQRLCELFTGYKFPRLFDLATQFRMGLMPIAIADYLNYNQLTVYATELRGMWEFVPVPGTIREDGTIDNSVPITVAAVVIMRDAARTENNLQYSWDFIDWWTDARAQGEYAKQYEAQIGMAAKYNTANMEALRSMPWTASEMKNLEAQFQSFKGTPEYPGGYIITRYVEFAFLDVYNNKVDPVQALLDNVDEINKEITRKRREFDLPVLGE